MKKRSQQAEDTLPKALTGIQGLDEITFGGLPLGRPTLICGGAGCGKTLMAMEFIVRGAAQFNEPGVFVSFEESPAEIITNVKSLGFDVDSLIRKKKIDVDYIHVEKSEIDITGEFDLEGLFIRLGYIIDSIGAKRIVLDTIESLFSGISNHAILRAELRRLFRWLKEKGMTAIITGERGDNTLTRQGLEEYVSDCVILLDHRIAEQHGTRRLRIVKYRGSFHGTNEYPFVITDKGISVVPISSLTLDHQVTNERVSSGVPSLDEMFSGKGYYRGSTVLVSGTAGSGKSSLLSSFVDSMCRKGEKCLYFALEESKDQIMRNMNAIGINLKQWEDKGLLKFHVTRPTHHSMEMHLAIIHKIINDFKPSGMVIDPISNFIKISSSVESSALLTRLVDFLKMKKITAVMANLTHGNLETEETDVQISSIVDTWLLLRSMETNGERNRTIFILKSRGMKHSNQVREFLITNRGIKLIDVYISNEGVMVGSARAARVKRDKAVEAMRNNERKALEANIKRLKQITEARIASLKLEHEAHINEMIKNFEQSVDDEVRTETSFKENAESRQSVNKTRNKENGK